MSGVKELIEVKKITDAVIAKEGLASFLLRGALQCEKTAELLKARAAGEVDREQLLAGLSNLFLLVSMSGHALEEISDKEVASRVIRKLSELNSDGEESYFEGGPKGA